MANESEKTQLSELATAYVRSANAGRRKYSVPDEDTMAELRDLIAEKQEGPGQGIVFGPEGVAALFDVAVGDLPKNARSLPYTMRDAFAAEGLAIGYTSQGGDFGGLVLRLAAEV